MDDSKGKGRALPRPDDTNNGESGDEPSSGPSFISRVAASASGLSRSALGAPNSNELNESAARAFQNASKGHASSSAGSSGWAESSTAQQLPHQSGGSSTFRAGQKEHHMRQSEDEFSAFLDGIDSFPSVPSDVVGVDHLASGQFGDAWSYAQVIGELENASQSRNRTVHEQESRDGEDVLTLLSEPNNAPLEPPQEDENYDWGLSAEQISELRAMTKDLFPLTEPHSAISPDNPLNLAPRLDESYLSSATQQEAAIAQENRRGQWEGVLTRYSDEVWGGLLPLVKEARKEIEDLRNNHSGLDQPKALRRLGAILGHLRKY